MEIDGKDGKRRKFWKNELNLEKRNEIFGLIEGWKKKNALKEKGIRLEGNGTEGFVLKGIINLGKFIFILFYF